MTIPLNGDPDLKAFAAAFREDIAKQMGIPLGFLVPPIRNPIPPRKCALHWRKPEDRA